MLSFLGYKTQNLRIPCVLGRNQESWEGKGTYLSAEKMCFSEMRFVQFCPCPGRRECTVQVKLSEVVINTVYILF